jgi:hypothetical protein
MCSIFAALDVFLRDHGSSRSWTKLETGVKVREDIEGVAYQQRSCLWNGQHRHL